MIMRKLFTRPQIYKETENILSNFWDNKVEITMAYKIKATEAEHEKIDEFLEKLLN